MKNGRGAVLPSNFSRLLARGCALFRIIILNTVHLYAYTCTYTYTYVAMALRKPRDHMPRLIDSVKGTYNVFAGHTCELFYISSTFTAHNGRREVPELA